MSFSFLTDMVFSLLAQLWNLLWCWADRPVRTQPKDPKDPAQDRCTIDPHFFLLQKRCEQSWAQRLFFIEMAERQDRLEKCLADLPRAIDDFHRKKHQKMILGDLIDHKHAMETRKNLATFARVLPDLMSISTYKSAQRTHHARMLEELDMHMTYSLAHRDAMKTLMTEMHTTLMAREKKRTIQGLMRSRVLAQMSVLHKQKQEQKDYWRWACKKEEVVAEIQKGIYHQKTTRQKPTLGKDVSEDLLVMVFVSFLLSSIMMTWCVVAGTKEGVGILWGLTVKLVEKLEEELKHLEKYHDANMAKRHRMRAKAQARKKGSVRNIQRMLHQKNKRW